MDLYRKAFAEHGDAPAAVLWPRGRQDIRFEALTRHFGKGGFSVLDYGCGLAHLKRFLDARFTGVEYRGADLLPEFVDAVRAKHPDAQVQRVASHHDVRDPVDHVVISGTFNIVEGDDADAYLRLVQEALVHLFSLARVSLAVNFMTDRVDFRQDRALHVSVAGLAEFARQRLSPRIRIDESYMPYEFTLVALKDSTIVRPDNTYRTA